MPQILNLTILKNKLILIGLLFNFLAFTTSAKTEYNIQIKINGISDSICYLAVYYGDKMHLVDTSDVDNNFNIIFKGKEKLSEGIYILAGENNNKLFEFIIPEKQKFKLKTDTSHIIDNMVVSGSVENKLFFEYLKYNSINYNKIKILKEKIIKFPDSTKVLKNQIITLNNNIKKYKLSFIENHSDAFFSKVLLAMEDPIIPKNISDDKLKFLYYKSHFWDNIDLTDNRFLLTPVLNNKIKTYFKNLVYKHPDSIIIAIDIIIKKTIINSEIYEYLIWEFISTYEQSKIMGFDKIFVHIAEKYFTNGNGKEENKEISEIISERAQKIKPLLIGKTAPNLILLDTSNQLISFQSFKNQFSLIIFWDFHCGSCKKEIMELKKLYDLKKFDLEIFAVCTDTSLSQWKNFIIDHKLNWINVNGTRSITKDYHQLYDIYSTPIIYILDNKKKIIAKKITAGQIEDFLINYLKI